MGEPGTSGDLLYLFLPYLLCLLLMAYPAFRIVSLYIEGGISTLALALSLASLLALMAGIGRTWGSPAGVALLLLFVLLCVGLPALNAVAERRLWRRLTEEDIEQCLRALRFDPKNVHAHSRLGDIYLRLRRYDEAIECYHQATRLAPKDHKEKRKLQYAVDRKRRAEVQSVFCPRCRTENAGHAVHCRECGTPLSAKRELLDLLHTARATGLIKWTACVSGVLMLVGAISRQVPWPLPVASGLVLACMGLLHLYLRRND
ncbi:MAG: tetratricopeptide repeat protein [Armatimonadota bacterium]